MRHAFSALILIFSNIAFGQSSQQKDGKTPKYDANTTIQGTKETFTRPIDPSATANRKAVDSRVLTKGPDGKWVVKKEGSHNLYQNTSTVITRNEGGALSVAQQGTGIKDRSANRYASDMQLATKYLKEAQTFPYKATLEGWGRPEDLEKYKEGDCADKSIWLVDKLLKASFENVRFILASPPKNSKEKVGHAWVEVKLNGEDYILDGTTKEPPLLKSQYIERYRSRFPDMNYYDRNGYHRGPPPSSSAKR